MSPDQRIEYGRAVWSAHQARRRDERIMSPAEWDLIRRWMDQKIPLRVVLRGIADTARAGRSLLYYEPSVTAAIKSWERALNVDATTL